MYKRGLRSGRGAYRSFGDTQGDLHETFLLSSSDLRLKGKYLLMTTPLRTRPPDAPDAGLGVRSFLSTLDLDVEACQPWTWAQRWSQDCFLRQACYRRAMELPPTAVRDTGARCVSPLASALSVELTGVVENSSHWMCSEARCGDIFTRLCACLHC
jgi:hypothetical protein